MCWSARRPGSPACSRLCDGASAKATAHSRAPTLTPTRGDGCAAGGRVPTPRPTPDVGEPTGATASGTRESSSVPALKCRRCASEASPGQRWAHHSARATHASSGHQAGVRPGPPGRRPPGRAAACRPADCPGRWSDPSRAPHRSPAHEPTVARIHAGCPRRRRWSYRPR